MNDPFDTDPEALRETIFEIVENQISDGTPPETRQTYDRLIAEGYSRDDTMKYIGCVVTSHIFDTLKHRKPYDEARYVAALQALPKLPWEE